MGNDGGAWLVAVRRLCQSWRRTEFLPHPTLSCWERAFRFAAEGGGFIQAAVDSRFRGNDGGGWLNAIRQLCQRWRRLRFLPLPTLSRWERAFRFAAEGGALFRQRWIPAFAGMTVGARATGGGQAARRWPSLSGRGLGEGETLFATQLWAKATRPVCRRPSGLSAVRGKPGFWIPACAGMTVGATLVVDGWVGRRSTALPLPTLSRWERTCVGRQAHTPNF